MVMFFVVAKDEYVIVVGVLKLRIRCVVVVLLLFRLLWYRDDGKVLEVIAAIGRNYLFT